MSRLSVPILICRSGGGTVIRLKVLQFLALGEECKKQLRLAPNSRTSFRVTQHARAHSVEKSRFAARALAPRNHTKFGNGNLRDFAIRANSPTQRPRDKRNIISQMKLFKQC